MSGASGVIPPSGAGSAQGFATHEYTMNDSHFELFQALARAQVGIELGPGKRELVYGRLVRRLRALNLSGFDPYVDLLQRPNSPELGEFVNAITTNVTSFFREPHHFEFLRDEAIPRLMENRKATKKLRLWSAASSIGPEPYTMAITAAEAMKKHPDWDLRILATDIDSAAVAKGQAGIYPRSEIPDITGMGDPRTWFEPVPPDHPGDPDRVRMAEHLRSMIYFRELNLMGDWPMRGPVDVIFCRNVVIYFSAETQRRLYRRFAQLLAPDGYVFIGHSESMLHSADLFELVGRTIYQPTSGSAGAGG